MYIFAALPSYSTEHGGTIEKKCLCNDEKDDLEVT